MYQRPWAAGVWCGILAHLLDSIPWLTHKGSQAMFLKTLLPYLGHLVLLEVLGACSALTCP